MVKAYLKYAQEASFGIVSSANAAHSAVFDKSGKMAVVPALENAAMWNIRPGLLTKIFRGKSGIDVTSLARSPNGTHFAVGFSDGSIRIYDSRTTLEEGEEERESGATLTVPSAIVLQGHRRAVTVLRYNSAGNLLASGGADTDIIVWDVLSEAGQCRLRGHTDAVTDLAFVGRYNALISSSKDTLVKVWDLDTQHCLQTLVGHTGEVWSIAVDEREGFLVTGSADAEMRVWRLDRAPFSEEERHYELALRQQRENRTKLTGPAPDPAAGHQPAAPAEPSGEDVGTAAFLAASTAEPGSFLPLAHYEGSLSRRDTERAGAVRFVEGPLPAGPEGAPTPAPESRAPAMWLLCQGKGVSVEVFRVRSDAEAVRHARRRQRRQQQKGADDEGTADGEGDDAPSETEPQPDGPEATLGQKRSREAKQTQPGQKRTRQCETKVSTPLRSQPPTPPPVNACVAPSRMALSHDARADGWPWWLRMATVQVEVIASDRFYSVGLLKCSAKIAAMDVRATSPAQHTIEVLAALHNNSIETYRLSLPVSGAASSGPEGTAAPSAALPEAVRAQLAATGSATLAGMGEPVLAARIEDPGHRTGIRALALSTDSGPCFAPPRPPSARSPRLLQALGLGVRWPRHALTNEGPSPPFSSSRPPAMVATSSAGSTKVWNTQTHRCLRTLATGYGLSVCFVPGNRYLVLGTKSGVLELWDVAAAVLLEAVKAHQGPVRPRLAGASPAYPLASSSSSSSRPSPLAPPSVSAVLVPIGFCGLVCSWTVRGTSDPQVWALAIRPDGRGMMSGGGDHEVRFWDFELISAPPAAQPSDDQPEGQPDAAPAPADGAAPAPKRLSMVHTRTLKLNDDVLCLAYTPNMRHICAGLLDSTIQVFFEDTLKFAMSMYGHKMPVLALDCSSDGALLVSGSADKNVRIWGLDFGNCHRSLFAHEEAVTAVRFVPETHYFFSAGKDRLVKYWDGDRFEEVAALEGHHAEVCALAITSDGAHLISSSLDRTVRLWKRTDEQLFAGEDREARLEQALDEQAVTFHQDDKAIAKATAESVRAGEDLMEALVTADAETEALDDARKAGLAPSPNPLLLGLSPARYVLRSLKQVPASTLENVLSVLPFASVARLLPYVATWLQEVATSPPFLHGLEVELVHRSLMHLLSLHQAQLATTNSAPLRETMERLAQAAPALLRREKDTMGFNMAALSFLQRKIDANANSFFRVEERLRAIAEARKTRSRARGARKRSRQQDKAADQQQEPQPDPTVSVPRRMQKKAASRRPKK
ncbi:putative U3 small nucleolar RNA-associated protein 12 [Paratrimastix pyriformis]|uniref:U3 small nucleolar RNA-associated protein 12 n=1 Tax=Paratrimastix pyriformis TaxID=342808 RepID=A0ABQ8UIC0_9EUKA|nr:putative U3 small nucleolar RNA-associated protein 12 [Paratrimastix pyriformis]